MKKIIFFYFLAFSTLSFAQAKLISGTVKDINTKEPIDIVSISIMGTNLGTISNGDGNYKITVPSESNKLSFSHLGYETKVYDISNSSTIDILLKPKEYQLNEVVIDKLSKEKLLRAVDSTSLAKLIYTPHLLKTYHREFEKKDDKYIRFADGLLDYYIHLETKGDQKLLYSDLSVEQSRIYDNRTFDVSEDEERLQLFTPWKVSDEVMLAYRFIGILKYTTLYDFHIDTKTDIDKNSINIITITPKQGVEEERLKVGTITYDVKTNLILDIDLKNSPQHKKYAKIHSYPDGSSFKDNDFAIKVSFKIDGDNYFMTYHRYKYNLDIGLPEDFDTIELVSDVTTLDYKPVDNKPSKFKKYKKDTLFENGNKYTDEFWKNQNIKLLTDEEENIIKTLNEKSATTAQGASN